MGYAHEVFEGKQITENIYLDNEGKYRWYYEYKMLSNPTLLFTIWRVLVFCMLPVYLFVCGITLWNGRSGVWEEIAEITCVFAILIGCIMVICVFAYLIVAAMYGWRYCVVFDMDEKGINHTQVQQQFKKAQWMSFAVMLLGLFSKRSGLVGQGMLVGSHAAMSSDWKQVKSVEPVGLEGEGSYVFLFDSKAWRYDAAERFEIFTTDKREVSFGLGTPGSCNDSVITLLRYDVAGSEAQEEVFRKLFKL